MSKKFKTTASGSGKTETICLYHGTDAISAEKIVKIGVNASMAIEAGGDGDFWVTRDRERAEWFAQVCNRSDQAEHVLLQLEVKKMILELLLQQDPPVAYEDLYVEGYVFQAGCFPALNEAIASIQTIKITQS